LIPSAIIPAYFGVTSWISAVVVSLAGLHLFLKSVSLFKTLNDKDAKKLMFGSFAYLPIILITFLIEFLIK
ncbi:MAG: protoheme IX farnesyltransferase, partial [Bacteroidia bacterium]